MEIINKLIKGVEDFPTLPTIYTALSEVMANPYSTPNDAAKIIASDQASAAKVLKTANSSIYGLKSKIDTITQAIFFIGFNEVKNLIIALSIIDLFKKTHHSQGLSPLDLWKHSIAVGVISRLIGKAAGADNVENYFISGILHDIGKLLFIRYLEKDYARTVQYAYQKNISIRDAETKILGVTHNIAGELIAEKWKLPHNIKDCIRFHYMGVLGNKPDLLTASIHIGNVVARTLELGDGGDRLIPEPNYDVWSILNLPVNTFTNLLPKIRMDYEQCVSLFLL